MAATGHWPVLSRGSFQPCLRATTLTNGISPAGHVSSGQASCHDRDHARLGRLLDSRARARPRLPRHCQRRPPAPPAGCRADHPVLQLGGYRSSSGAQRKLQSVTEARWLRTPDRPVGRESAGRTGCRQGRRMKRSVLVLDRPSSRSPPSGGEVRRCLNGRAVRAYAGIVPGASPRRGCPRLPEIRSM